LVKETSDLEDPSKVPENPSEPLEDPRTLAKRLLAEGSTVDEVVAETNLSKPTVLGFLGAARKAEKRLDKTEALQPAGKSNQEEETLVNDLRDEAKLTGAALTLARNQNRLKAVAPGLYDALHGKETQAESSPSRTLIDLEVLREIKAMRAQDEGSHRNNGDSQNTVELQKQINALREELHQKDVQNLRDETTELKQELKEIRSELRSSAGSNSDLAVVVRETSNLIGKALESPGVLRNYLLPDGSINIGKKADAPALLHTQVETGNGTVVSELRGRGLVTRIIQKEGSL